MIGIKQKTMEATRYLQRQRPFVPEIGLILGTGLGNVANEIEDQLVIPYKDIPYMPVSTVSGHAGQIVLGILSGRPVACFQGRFHYYEGYNMEEITFPIRLMAALGTKILIITNAAGGINKQFDPGDLMLITDHFNFMGTNPLIGPNDPDLGPRFPSMTPAYDRKLVELARQVAQTEGIDLKEGVYIGVPGPSFETPAELTAFAKWGIDAVGMSTVPEVIVARHADLRVLAISAITNAARGEEHEVAQHRQVLSVAAQAGITLGRLVSKIVTSCN